MNRAEAVLFGVLRDAKQVGGDSGLSDRARLALVGILKEAARNDYYNRVQELNELAPERKPRTPRKVLDAPINVMQPKEFTSMEIEQVGNGYWGKLDLVKAVKNRLEMQLIDAKRYVEAHQNELFRYLGVKTYPQNQNFLS